MLYRITPSQLTFKSYFSDVFCFIRRHDVGQRQISVGPEYKIFVKMTVLKTLLWIEAATEKCSREKTFLKFWEILNDYKSERDSLKISLKERIFDKVAGPQSATPSIFQIICKLFKSNCFKENCKEKSKNFEMQCMLHYSWCIALYIQLFQLVRLTVRCSTNHGRITW